MVEHERSGVVDWVTWSFSRVAMWAPAFIVCVILYEVFVRYIVGSSTYWANELSLWVAGGVYLTAGLYAMQQRSHIRIFILYDMAPRWARKLFDVIGVLCVCIFAFAVVYGGFNEAWAKLLRWERFGTVFDPPIPATLKPLILLLMVVLAVQAVSNLIRDWPAPAIVRKSFDVLAYALVMSGVAAVLLFALSLLAAEPREWNGTPVNIPDIWLWAMAAFVLVVAVLATLGLVRDFDRTPDPVVEGDDIAEDVDVIAKTLEGVPQETLSGNPPVPGKKNHP